MVLFVHAENRSKNVSVAKQHREIRDSYSRITRLSLVLKPQHVYIIPSLNLNTVISLFAGLQYFLTHNILRKRVPRLSR